MKKLFNLEAQYLEDVFLSDEGEPYMVLPNCSKVLERLKEYNEPILEEGSNWLVVSVNNKLADELEDEGLFPICGVKNLTSIDDFR